VFFFDPLWFIIMLPPLFFMIYAQAKVSSTYSKYSKVANMYRMTGAQAADRLLAMNGLGRVKVESVRGRLTDHYDPAKKVLRLSPDIYSGTSVAAIGIVAHEVGHAVQDATGYAFMRFRTSLVPAANLGSQLGFISVLVGALLAGMGAAFGTTIIWGGVFLFSLVVLFSLVTLPVEYNASNRARAMLRSAGLVSANDYQGASAVLSAAALTYVAATLQAAAQLFYFISIALGSGRRQ
jgi:Zn-dependent membrane protease YugP